MLKIIIKDVLKNIENSRAANQRVKLLAVTKTHPKEVIQKTFECGIKFFGENKVQEAISKWKEIKKNDSNLKLHMVGKLQSNKSKKAVELFDFIHSLDNKKLADSLSKAELETKRNIK